MNPTETAEPAAEVAEEDHLRAEMYALLSQLLIAPPSAEVLEALAAIESDDSDFGQAVGALAAAAAQTNAEAAKEEYQALFVGLAQGELQPYASFYLAGGLYRQPLADLRGDMKKLGIARREDAREPEDHIASLCEVMAAMALGTLWDGPVHLDAQRRFFEAHIEPWAPKFFSDLERAESAAFYMPIGRLGSLFMEIERQGFEFGE
jgi:TorA maturation chaperone TorD